MWKADEAKVRYTVFSKMFRFEVMPKIPLVSTTKIKSVSKNDKYQNRSHQEPNRPTSTRATGHQPEICKDEKQDKREANLPGIHATDVKIEQEMSLGFTGYSTETST